MSLKGPTVKRIREKLVKEAAELSSSPSPDYHAAPLDHDLYIWHFTLRGPSPPSPFSLGIYHGIITLPPSYPLKPPNFRFLTPSGRFEVNREICLSISSHHEESWQPAWGIRTALVALRAHMDEAGGQVGGMRSEEGVRRRLAGESRGWRCVGCGGGRSNEEVLLEQERLSVEIDEEMKKKREREEEEAKGLSFEVKGEGEGGTETEEDGAEASGSKSSAKEKTDGDATGAVGETTPKTHVPTRTVAVADPAVSAQPDHPNHLQLPPGLLQHQQQELPRVQAASRDVWLDRAIIGVVIALLFMVLRQFY